MKRNVLTVFLASPGDLNSERQIVRDAVTRANKLGGHASGLQSASRTNK
jgi:hypothetical protein